MEKIDFKQVAARALTSLESLVNQWLPGGKRVGPEYQAINPTRSDSKSGSFSINLNTGAWADFATDDKGGDAISLYAYIFGESPLNAAKEIMQQLGISTASAPPAQTQIKKPRSEWSPVVPVPDDATVVPVAHIKRGKPDQTWAYRTAEGGLVGYIWRFTTSDGGKEIIPLTYCKHAVTGAQEWRWMAFPEPRALYVPGEWRKDVIKLVVEGEKCADVARQLPDYDAVSWPGGSKAVDKADWSRFKAGDRVLLWPDCDAQTDKEGVLLPERRQPGIAAMEKIAQKLMAQGCKVRVVTIPQPGEKPSGWDIADAMKDGMSVEDVCTFLKNNRREPFALTEKSISTATLAAAGDWREHLFLKEGLIRECRENVFMVLRHHPAWAGCLWRDEFSNRIVIRRDTPIGKRAGEEWQEEDDFKLGLWLAKNLRFFIKANAMLSDGIRAEAEENKFHPVREHLDGLVWDGVPRLDDWLSDFIGVDKTLYSMSVSRYFLRGMVARIYKPGCKMDTALIMEGLQGGGKSTVATILAGGKQWFSDTVFVMGDKDSFQSLRGKWVYELAELDALGKAEATRAKAFISSSVDSYRAPYDRQTKDWARQCVFIGSTNQYEYLKDSSGNRRYWPVLCHGEVNLEGFLVARDQLFAEAVAQFKAGERWYPSRQEQDELFTPEQEARELADPWLAAIARYIENNTFTEVSTLDILTAALKVEISKIDGARQMTTRVGICMRKLGWGKERKTTGTREYVYTRPKPKTVGDDVEMPF